MKTMTQYVARVRNRRLVLDVPTELPEGSEVPLVAADADDLSELSDAERRQLAAEIAAARADEAAGRFEDVEDLLKQLRRQ